MTPLPPSKLQQPTAGRGRRTPRSSDDIDSMHHQNPRDLHQQQQQEHHSSSFDEKDHEHLPSLQLDHARKLLQHEHEEGKDEHHHDEVVATMRLLKQYIDTLETENDALSETCRSQRNQLEQCSPTSTASSFAMSISTISSDNSKKAVQQKEGLGWSDVAVMAKKLSVMKKENDTLKDALAVKTRQLEKSLKLNKELQTKLEKLLLQVQGPLAVEEENREVPDLSEKTTELVSQECVKPQKDNNDNTGNSNPSPHETDEHSDDKKQNDLVLTMPGDKVATTDSDHGVHDSGTKTDETADPQCCGRDMPKVETVTSDSDDDSDDDEEPDRETKKVNSASNVAPENADKTEPQTEASEQGNGNDDASAIQSEEEAEVEEEAMDELGPLPSNPFNSLRQPKTFERPTEPSHGCSLSEMQEYLKQLAQAGQRKHGTVWVETKESAPPSDTDMTTEDARLQILENMGKFGRFRDKLFRRIQLQDKTLQLAEAMSEVDGKEPVWC